MGQAKQRKNMQIKFEEEFENYFNERIEWFLIHYDDGDNVTFNWLKSILYKECKLAYAAGNGLKNEWQGDL